MKGVPIKFRAKEFETNKYVYGRSIIYYKGKGADIILLGEQAKDCFSAVDPDSISQLCGYDADGNEVYEGDKLYYYRCSCVSGDYIRQNKIPKAGVCTVIDAHCLDGLFCVGLNDHFDYEFLLKNKVNAK